VIGASPRFTAKRGKEIASEITRALQLEFAGSLYDDIAKHAIRTKAMQLMLANYPEVRRVDLKFDDDNLTFSVTVI
jgi:hypothetical protein